MRISLSSELKKFVEEKVKTEHYSSANDVFNHSLRLLDQRDRIHQKPTDELRQQLKIGLKLIREKRVVDFEQQEYFQLIAVELIKRGSIEGNYTIYQHLAN
jgi:putative addiction module CopG family antidote